jgi:hypothetical protein
MVVLHDTLFKPFITTIPNAIDDPLIYESWLTCFEALRCSTCGHILSDESYETIVTLVWILWYFLQKESKKFYFRRI